MEVSAKHEKALTSFPNTLKVFLGTLMEVSAKTESSEEWKQTRQFFTYYEIWFLHACGSRYMNITKHSVTVKGSRCREIAGDTTVSKAKA